MTEDTTNRDDELAPDVDETEGAADEAEAEEAMAAAEESFYDDEGDLLDEEAAAAQREEAMSEALHEGLLARASWSLVHKELLLLLFANCLFFAGVLAAWARYQPWDERMALQAADEAVGLAEDAYNQAERKYLDDQSTVNTLVLQGKRASLERAYAARKAAKIKPDVYYNGLSTIRGSLIFMFAIFGFFIFVVCIRFRQVIIWPFLLNALFALWVGIPGFTNNVGSARWEAAQDYMDAKTASILEKIMAPLSTVPPGHWLLTFGGALVLIVLLKGVFSGMSAAKAKQASSAGSRRRRR